MDAKLLQKVMDLAEKTGDRVIVVNPKNGTAHAVMPFAAYEKLVSNTASLRNLGDDQDYLGDSESDEDEEECLLCKEMGIDSDDSDDDVKLLEADDDEIPSIEELNRISEQVLRVDKKPELSQKIADDLAPLDILEDQENEEQYYLEPLE
jgi:hypothetical protein